MRLFLIALLSVSTMAAGETWYQSPFAQIDQYAQQQTLTTDEHLAYALALAHDLRVSEASEQMQAAGEELNDHQVMRQILLELLLANDILEHGQYMLLFDQGMRLAQSLQDFQSLALLLIEGAEQSIYQRDMDGALTYLEQAVDVINEHDLPLMPAVELAYARYYFESANWPLVEEQILSTRQALADHPMPTVAIELQFLMVKYALDRLPLVDAQAELAALEAMPYDSQRLQAKIRRAHMLYAGASGGNYIEAANALFDQIDQMQSASESLVAKHVIAHVMVDNQDPQAIDGVADLSADLHRLPRNAFRDWIELDYWYLKYEFLRAQGEFEAALFALEAHNTLSQKLWENNSAGRSERLKAYFSREAAKYEQAMQAQRDEIDSLTLQMRWWMAFSAALVLALIFVVVHGVNRSKYDLTNSADIYRNNKSPDHSS